jgi:hypothetical protein
MLTHHPTVVGVRQIVFSPWVTLSEHKWVILRERRGGGLHSLRKVGAGWGRSARAGAWLLQPSGVWPGRRMDCHLCAAVPVPGLRPHDEPVAGLAASVAMVCGGGGCGSAVPAFDSGRTARAIGVLFGRRSDATEWRSLRRWRAQLLVSPTLWLASITTGYSEEGREPGTGPGASVAVAGRNRNGRIRRAD